jgi:transposase
MDIAVRRPITARNRRHSAEILADNQSKSSFAACFRARLTILTTRGWFKECRALGTRYDKLAVNYVALWIVANVHYLLRKYTKTLGKGLSETT